jgi:hypothetical protein
MRASAWNALWNHLVAATVVIALRGIFGTSLRVLALESLISNLLTVVALHWLGLVFKGAGYARLSPCVKEPLSQEPPCITAFGQVNNH